MCTVNRDRDRQKCGHERDNNCCSKNFHCTSAAMEAEARKRMVRYYFIVISNICENLLDLIKKTAKIPAFQNFHGQISNLKFGHLEKSSETKAKHVALVCLLILMETTSDTSFFNVCSNASKNEKKSKIVPSRDVVIT